MQHILNGTFDWREVRHAHRRRFGLQRPRSGHARPRVPRTQGGYQPVSSVSGWTKDMGKDVNQEDIGNTVFTRNVSVYDDNELDVQIRCFRSLSGITTAMNSTSILD